MVKITDIVERNSLRIPVGENLSEEMKNSVVVHRILIDRDETCLHCGKNLKAGKTVAGAQRDIMRLAYPVTPNFMFRGKIFCSTSHARIYVKKNKGL